MKAMKALVSLVWNALRVTEPSRMGLPDNATDSYGAMSPEAEGNVKEASTTPVEVSCCGRE
jgi:hypothetical protein